MPSPANQYPRGVKLLHDPVRNKGTAFSEEERERFGLRGLLPPRIQSQELQVKRVLENLRRKESDLERYINLVGLQDRNETLFYRLAIDHLDEIVPLIYTPTVGRACQEFGHIFRRPRGLFLSADDQGRMAEVLGNWPHRDVRIAVVTDGGRILGLGDLGANGMGIPIGKLSLYSACAGIHPTYCLPLVLDVGTDNESLLEDPLYIGLPRRRLRGPAYDELIEELFEAMAEVFPRALVQLEDFANENAFRLLARYRDRCPVFDDDIQGTGAVALAGLLSALRLSGGRLRDGTYLFLGAGEAAIGIADSLVAAMKEEGLSESESRARCWLVDSQGLVVTGRGEIAPHKRPYVQQARPAADLLSAIRAVRPTALIGASGAPGTFTKAVLETMAELNERPIVLALSNPTSKSECTAREAYRYTGGRALFASGSPFPPFEFEGRTLIPGQSNNAYIFPGVGLGAIASGARRVTDEMFLAAARALAGMVSEQDLALGRLYPALTRIRDVSRVIATAVAEIAWERGLGAVERPSDIEGYVASRMFDPRYEDPREEASWRFD